MPATPTGYLSPCTHVGSRDKRLWARHPGWQLKNPPLSPKDSKGNASEREGRSDWKNHEWAPPHVGMNDSKSKESFQNLDICFPSLEITFNTPPLCSHTWEQLLLVYCFCCYTLFLPLPTPCSGLSFPPC